MILGFKPIFPEPILKEIKIHSIREDKHNRWKKDRKIHMATGVRTKNYHCFKEDVCRGTQKIKIRLLDAPLCIEIYIDGEIRYNSLIPDKDRSFFIWSLSKNDGFDSINDFFKWFNTDFDGKIIHWTDFRY